MKFLTLLMALICLVNTIATASNVYLLGKLHPSVSHEMLSDSFAQADTGTSVVEILSYKTGYDKVDVTFVGTHLEYTPDEAEEFTVCTYRFVWLDAIDNWHHEDMKDSCKPGEPLD